MSQFFKIKRNKPEIGLKSQEDASDRERTAQPVSMDGAMNLEASLQQPVEDSKINREFSMLREQIRSHALSFYHQNSLEASRADIDTLVREQINDITSEEAATLTNMLLSSKSRVTGLQILLARALIKNISFVGDTQHTLLSPAAVALMSLFESRKSKHISQEHYQLALARWKILTTFLTAAPDSEPPVPDFDVPKRIERLDPLLSPFISANFSRGEGKEERENHLTTVIRCAAKLGLMLFSQPTTWVFEWEVPQERSEETAARKTKTHATSMKGVVVYPALWKTADIDGRELPRAELKQYPEVDSSSSAVQCTVAATRSIPSKNSLLPNGSVRQQEMDTVPEMTAEGTQEGEQRPDRKREQPSSIGARFEKYFRTGKGSERLRDGQRVTASASSHEQDLMSRTLPPIPREISVAEAVSRSAKTQYPLETQRPDTLLESSYSGTLDEDMPSEGSLVKQASEKSWESPTKAQEQTTDRASYPPRDAPNSLPRMREESTRADFDLVPRKPTNAYDLGSNGRPSSRRSQQTCLEPMAVAVELLPHLESPKRNLKRTTQSSPLDRTMQDDNTSHKDEADKRRVSSIEEGLNGSGSQNLVASVGYGKDDDIAAAQALEDDEPNHDALPTTSNPLFTHHNFGSQRRSGSKRSRPQKASSIRKTIKYWAS